jgi:ABC-type amino acid transport substrate-binding protein
MPRYFLILLLVVLLIGSLTACGQSKTETTKDVASPSEVTTVELDPAGYYNLLNNKTIATIYLNNSEQIVQQSIEKYFKQVHNVDLNLAGVVYVDSLTDGLLMLRTRKVAAIQVMGFTGRYLVQRNNDLSMYVNEFLTLSTQLIFSIGKRNQLDQVNVAINAMKADGTLDKLTEQWITNLPAGKEPSGGVMPVINGAETIRVGISGDAPPLDYIATDGVPGGFNVAVLSEIGRRANLNIELVTVNSNSRFTALQSGKIDSFLWHNTFNNLAGFIPGSTQTDQLVGPPSFLESDSYLNGRGCLVVSK